MGKKTEADLVGGRGEGLCLSDIFHNKLILWKAGGGIREKGKNKKQKREKTEMILGLKSCPW